MIKEVCVENFTAIPRAIAAGADRIELCDNLAVGGTTVSVGVMARAAKYCADYDTPLMVLIRPRGGDFIYNADECNIMLRDIATAKALGVAGIVIGALTLEGDIDKSFIDICIAAADGLDLTFHMAFDAIALDKQLATIDWLANRGFRRILTHGGNTGQPIAQTIARLQQYIVHANNRIVIMPGGGVRRENLQALAAVLDTSEFHGTKIV
jgi:copper homeostasis protein